MSFESGLYWDHNVMEENNETLNENTRAGRREECVRHERCRVSC